MDNFEASSLFDVMYRRHSPVGVPGPGVGNDVVQSNIVQQIVAGNQGQSINHGPPQSTPHQTQHVQPPDAQPQYALHSPNIINPHQNNITSPKMPQQNVQSKTSVLRQFRKTDYIQDNTKHIQQNNNNNNNNQTYQIPPTKPEDYNQNQDCVPKLNTSTNNQNLVPNNNNNSESINSDNSVYNIYGVNNRNYYQENGQKSPCFENFQQRPLPNNNLNQSEKMCNNYWSNQNLNNTPEVYNNIIKNPQDYRYNYCQKKSPVIDNNYYLKSCENRSMPVQNFQNPLDRRISPVNQTFPPKSEYGNVYIEKHDNYPKNYPQYPQTYQKGPIKKPNFTILEQRLTNQPFGEVTEYMHPKFPVIQSKASLNTHRPNQFIPGKNIPLEQNKFTDWPYPREFRDNRFFTEIAQLDSRMAQGIIQQHNSMKNYEIPRERLIENLRIPYQNKMRYPDPNFQNPRPNIRPGNFVQDIPRMETENKFIRKDFGSCKVDGFRELCRPEEYINQVRGSYLPMRPNGMQENPQRNISPRSTFQENMHTIVIPPQAIQNFSQNDFYNQNYFNKEYNPSFVEPRGNVQVPRPYQNRYPESYPDYNRGYRPDFGHFLEKDRIDDPRKSFESKDSEVSKLNLKEFFENWEDDEEIVANLPDLIPCSNVIERNMSVDSNYVSESSNDKTSYDEVRSVENLYILEKQNISPEMLVKFQHLTPVEKLPANIKDFTKITSDQVLNLSVSKEENNNVTTEKTPNENHKSVIVSNISAEKVPMPFRSPENSELPLTIPFMSNSSHQTENVNRLLEYVNNNTNIEINEKEDSLRSVENDAESTRQPIKSKGELKSYTEDQIGSLESSPGEEIGSQSPESSREGFISTTDPLESKGNDAGDPHKDKTKTQVPIEDFTSENLERPSLVDSIEEEPKTPIRSKLVGLPPGDSLKIEERGLNEQTDQEIQMTKDSRTVGSLDDRTNDFKSDKIIENHEKGSKEISEPQITVLEEKERASLKRGDMKGVAEENVVSEESLERKEDDSCSQESFQEDILSKKEGFGALQDVETSNDIQIKLDKTDLSEEPEAQPTVERESNDGQIEVENNKSETVAEHDLKTEMEPSKNDVNADFVAPMDQLENAVNLNNFTSTDKLEDDFLEEKPKSEELPNDHKMSCTTESAPNGFDENTSLNLDLNSKNEVHEVTFEKVDCFESSTQNLESLKKPLEIEEVPISEKTFVDSAVQTNFDLPCSKSGKKQCCIYQKLFFKRRKFFSKSRKILKPKRKEQLQRLKRRAKEVKQILKRKKESLELEPVREEEDKMVPFINPENPDSEEREPEAISIKTLEVKNQDDSSLTDGLKLNIPSRKVSIITDGVPNLEDSITDNILHFPKRRTSETTLLTTFIPEEKNECLTDELPLTLKRRRSLDKGRKHFISIEEISKNVLQALNTLSDTSESRKSQDSSFEDRETSQSSFDEENYQESINDSTKSAEDLMAKKESAENALAGSETVENSILLSMETCETTENSILPAVETSENTKNSNLPTIEISKIAENFTLSVMEITEFEENSTISVMETCEITESSSLPSMETSEDAENSNPPLVKTCEIAEKPTLLSTETSEIQDSLEAIPESVPQQKTTVAAPLVEDPQNIEKNTSEHLFSTAEPQTDEIAVEIESKKFNICQKEEKITVDLDLEKNESVPRASQGEEYELAKVPKVSNSSNLETKLQDLLEKENSQMEQVSSVTVPEELVNIFLVQDQSNSEPSGEECEVDCITERAPQTEEIETEKDEPGSQNHLPKPEIDQMEIGSEMEAQTGGESKENPTSSKELETSDDPPQIDLEVKPDPSSVEDLPERLSPPRLEIEVPIKELLQNKTDLELNPHSSPPKLEPDPLKLDLVEESNKEKEEPPLLEAEVMDKNFIQHSDGLSEILENDTSIGIICDTNAMRNYNFDEGILRNSPVSEVYYEEYIIENSGTYEDILISSDQTVIVASDECSNDVLKERVENSEILLQQPGDEILIENDDVENIFQEVIIEDGQEEKDDLCKLDEDPLALELTPPPELKRDDFITKRSFSQINGLFKNAPFELDIKKSLQLSNIIRRPHLNGSSELPKVKKINLNDYRKRKQENQTFEKIVTAESIEQNIFEMTQEERIGTPKLDQKQNEVIKNSFRRNSTGTKETTIPKKSFEERRKFQEKNRQTPGMKNSRLKEASAERMNEAKSKPQKSQTERSTPRSKNESSTKVSSNLKNPERNLRKSIEDPSRNLLRKNSEESFEKLDERKNNEKKGTSLVNGNGPKQNEGESSERNKNPDRKSLNEVEELVSKSGRKTNGEKKGTILANGNESSGRRASLDKRKELPKPKMSTDFYVRDDRKVAKLTINKSKIGFGEDFSKKVKDVREAEGKDHSKKSKSLKKMYLLEVENGRDMLFLDPLVLKRSHSEEIRNAKRSKIEPKSCYQKQELIVPKKKVSESTKDNCDAKSDATPPKTDETNNDDQSNSKEILPIKRKRKKKRFRNLYTLSESDDELMMNDKDVLCSNVGLKVKIPRDCFENDVKNDSNNYLNFLVNNSISNKNNDKDIVPKVLIKKNGTTYVSSFMKNIKEPFWQPRVILKRYPSSEILKITKNNI